MGAKCHWSGMVQDTHHRNPIVILPSVRVKLSFLAFYAPNCTICTESTIVERLRLILLACGFLVCNHIQAYKWGMFAFHPRWNTVATVASETRLPYTQQAVVQSWEDIALVLSFASTFAQLTMENRRKRWGFHAILIRKNGFQSCRGTSLCSSQCVGKKREKIFFTRTKTVSEFKGKVSISAYLRQEQCEW